MNLLQSAQSKIIFLLIIIMYLNLYSLSTLHHALGVYTRIPTDSHLFILTLACIYLFIEIQRTKVHVSSKHYIV